MGNKPMASYKDGLMDISIWKKTNNDKDSFSLKLRKSYKDKNEQWAEQNLNIFERDIAKCICLLGESYRFIMSQKIQGTSPQEL
ncbi:MAG: hypothetical protein PHW04_09420 [Candidatus Wallbacteria bacterium]|nr:hypothetical protein [Candidatus Wallbacteria bacterium]